MYDKAWIDRESQTVTYSLAEYFSDTTPWPVQDWQRNMCARLETLLFKKGQRIILHAPPQSGKSVVVSQRLPSWLLGYDPLLRVRLAAYNVSHAERFSDINRQNMADPIYQMRFPSMRSRLAGSNTLQEWSTQANIDKRVGQPSFLALGVGTGFTGMGADCFTGDTLVSTEIGLVPISRLHEMPCKPKVYSFNHHTQSVELSSIICSRKIVSNEIIKVRTSAGRTFKCTKDHRIFCDKEYRPAGMLPSKGNLSVLRWTQRQTEQDVPQMPDCRLSRKSYMQLLWNRVFQAALRTSKIVTKRVQRQLLYEKVFFGTSCNKERQKMSILQQTYAWKAWEKILFGKVQGNGNKSSERREKVKEAYSVQELQDDVFTQKPPKPTLLQRMCRYHPFYSDDGQKQFSLQNRTFLQQIFHRNAPVHIGERWLSVRCVSAIHERIFGGLAWEKNFSQQSINTPHQRRPFSKHSGKSCEYVQTLPRDTPQIGGDTVAVVERLCGLEEFVYDIQVEGNSNFFANEVLVHNCFIIDDIYKNEQEASSPTINANIWSWWENVVQMRVNEETNIIVMMHRWRMNDFPGMLLEKGGWEEIRYPARIDNDDDAKVDPMGRKKGQILSPLLSPKILDKIQKENPMGYLALQQGRPTAVEGNMFTSEMLCEDPETDGLWEWPDSDITEAVLIADTATKTKRHNDFTGLALMFRCADGFNYIYPIILDKMKVPDVERCLANAWSEWKVKLGDVLMALAVEEGAGTAVVQNLEVKTAQRDVDRRKAAAGKSISAPAGWQVEDYIKFLLAPPIVLAPFPALSDKITNASKVLAAFRYRRFRLIDTPWSSAWLGQLKVFPQGAHDDAVDATVNGAKWLLGIWGKGAEAIDESVFANALAEEEAIDAESDAELLEQLLAG